MQFSAINIPHGSYAVFETSVGQNLVMARVDSNGLVTKIADDTRFLVPLEPITPELFRATAETLEYAEKNGFQFFSIIFCGSDMGAFAR